MRFTPVNNVTCTHGNVNTKQRLGKTPDITETQVTSQKGNIMGKKKRAKHVQKVVLKTVATACKYCDKRHPRLARGLDKTRNLLNVYFKLLASASRHGWFLVTIDGILVVTSIMFIFVELPAIDEMIKQVIERFNLAQESIEAIETVE